LKALRRGQRELFDLLHGDRRGLGYVEVDFSCGESILARTVATGQESRDAGSAGYFALLTGFRLNLA
jgi:hypothetical protein